ncbi:MAG TPA: sugar ABC transporter permease [Rectinemataceae bacterium]|nr:sugar ABC transporter permease [Rectinemataceae bacterium]
MRVASFSFERQEARFGVALVLPSLIVLAALVLYPIGYNIFLSFNDVSFTSGNVFVGLKNYSDLLGDVEFWNSFGTSATYVLFSTFGSTLLGLVVALMMNVKFPFRGLVRGLLLFPYVAPVISVVFSWQFFFDPVQGPFAYLAVDVLHLASKRFNLIGDPSSALWVAIVFNIWRSFPFMYLMILSRLQAIDETLYEAAEMDGADSWVRFRHIIFPELRFVIGALVLLRFIWNFNKFEEVFLLTDNVKVLPVFTYFKAFLGTQEIGQAAAIAVIQMIVLTGVILIYAKKVLKW